MLLIVLMSEMALAAAASSPREPAAVMSVMFGVSFAITGIVAASITQPIIVSATSGLLADGRAHAAFAHAVGTTEVQLDAVGAGIGRAFHELMPVLARVDHQRGDDRVIGPAFFHLGDFAEIGFRRAIADQLDVVEADHAAGRRRSIEE